MRPTDHHIAQLLLHGSFVLLAGILSGFPYWRVIILDKGAEAARFWRVTHSFLVVFGLAMLVFGLIVPATTLSPAGIRLLVWAMVSAGYGFVLAFVVGSWRQMRGLTPRPYGLNTVLFAGHGVGIIGSLLGTALLVYGLWRNLP